MRRFPIPLSGAVPGPTGGVPNLAPGPATGPARPGRKCCVGRVLRCSRGLDGCHPRELTGFGVDGVALHRPRGLRSKGLRPLSPQERVRWGGIDANPDAHATWLQALHTEPSQSGSDGTDWVWCGRRGSAPGPVSDIEGVATPFAPGAGAMGRNRRKPCCPCDLAAGPPHGTQSVWNPSATATRSRNARVVAVGGPRHGKVGAPPSRSDLSRGATPREGRDAKGGLGVPWSRVRTCAWRPLGATC